MKKRKRFGCFLLESTKILSFSPIWGENWEEKDSCSQMTELPLLLHVDCLIFLFFLGDIFNSSFIFVGASFFLLLFLFFLFSFLGLIGQDFFFFFWGGAWIFLFNKLGWLSYIFFFCLVVCLSFFASFFYKGTLVNLYKFIFLSSQFSSQPNKFFFFFLVPPIFHS